MRLESTGVGPFGHGLLVTYDGRGPGGARRSRVGGSVAYDPRPGLRIADPARRWDDPGARAVRGRSAVRSEGGLGRLAGHLDPSGGFVSAGRRPGPGTGVSSLIAAMLVGLLYSAIVAGRSREIGLLMALGSRGRHVVQMFLAEASVTTGAGRIARRVIVGAGLLLAFRRLGRICVRDGPGPDRLASTGDDRRDRRRLRGDLQQGSACWVRPSPPGEQAGARPYEMIRGEVH